MVIWRWHREVKLGSGEPVIRYVGRFVWTDTWLRRNGKWQIVAVEDLIAPEQPVKP